MSIILATLNSKYIHTNLVANITMSIKSYRYLKSDYAKMKG